MSFEPPICKLRAQHYINSIWLDYTYCQAQRLQGREHEGSISLSDRCKASAGCGLLMGGQPNEFMKEDVALTAGSTLLSPLNIQQKDKNKRGLHRSGKLEHIQVALSIIINVRSTDRLFRASIFTSNTTARMRRVVHVHFSKFEEQS